MAFQSGLKTSSIKRSISWMLKGFQRKWTALELLAASVSWGWRSPRMKITGMGLPAAFMRAWSSRPGHVDQHTVQDLDDQQPKGTCASARQHK
jgi:hypothetical protein